ncbi:MAG TPA: DUF1508 domain-containing protein [Candidatus Bathyarchaeia archaeon]
MPPKFQLYKDAAGKFRFRVIAENNDIVASSEAYEQYASCMKGINSVKKNSGSEVEDLTINNRKVLNPKYQIFKDTANEFRFRLKAPNGEIIAQSEGYGTKDACLNGIEVVKRSRDARIDDSLVTGKPVEESVSEAKKYAKSAKASIADAEAPSVKLPAVEVPEVKMPDVKVSDVETKTVIHEVEVPEKAIPEVETKEFPRTVSVSPVEAGISKEPAVTETKPKGMSIVKELLISFVGLVIALILSALALGIANWGIGFFGITGDVAKAAAIIAVAIVIGPTIAAFATKKYF